MNDLTLLNYLKNTASADEIRQVLDWLDASPENREYLDSLDNIDAAVDFHRTRLQGVKTKVRPLYVQRIVRWSAAAAAVVAVGLGTGYFMAERQLSYITSQQISTTAPNGQRISVTLSDGTSVWLNAGSSITYPPVFAKKERRVRLSGEAIFDVTHSAKHPFVVETFAADAKVLGTKFDIVSDEAAGVFSAALLSGKLQLTSRTSGETVVMAPDEIVRIVDGEMYSEPLSDHDDYLWPEGIISLKGLSFEELMARFERAYNVRIVIARSTMPEANFGWGKISVSSGIEHALDVLSYATDFNYTIDKNNGVITIN